jgi:CubicO group peptidase (beta-lactamase class C family)
MSSPRRWAPAAVVACALLLTGCAMAPRAAVEPLPQVSAEQRRLDDLAQRSDAIMTQLVGEGQPGCSAAVAILGEVAWAGAAGLADLSTGTPVTTETRFDIASISKQFTATAILMLQREGKVTLSDPIGAYVPGMPDWASTVTLDQLIHHTARIPDFWVELDDVGIGFGGAADQATTLAAIARETELEPGEGYLYSNSHYVLLAEVVVAVTGQTLPEFLADRIFTPLDLDMVVAPTMQGADIARSYDDNGQLQVGGWTSYGHTGIITTPSELARWGDQYREGDIIADDFATGAVPEGAGELYAAGIDIEVDGDLNHTGRWGGYVSDFTVSDDRDTTIAVACNGHLGNRFGIAEALWALWEPHSKE